VQWHSQDSLNAQAVEMAESRMAVKLRIKDGMLPACLAALSHPRKTL